MTTVPILFLLLNLSLETRAQQSWWNDKVTVSPARLLYTRPAKPSHSIIWKRTNKKKTNTINFGQGPVHLPAPLFRPTVVASQPIGVKDVHTSKSWNLLRLKCDPKNLRHASRKRGRIDLLKDSISKFEGIELNLSKLENRFEERS